MYRIAISWEDDLGTKSQDGKLEDKSRSGAGIFVNRAIPPGTRVNVKERNQDRSGTVRYCRPDETGFFIGIKYDFPADEADPSK